MNATTDGNDDEDVPFIDDSAVLSMTLPQKPAAANNAFIRTPVWNALVHCIVSNRGLWETVDVAEVKQRMEAGLAALPADLSLIPLWDYLREKRTPIEPATQMVLFFASRAPRWNITMTLPPALAGLSQAERDAHIERMRSQGGSSGTHVGTAPVAPPAAARDGSRSPRPVVNKPPPAESPLRVVLQLAVRVAFMIMSMLFIADRVWGNEIEPHYGAALGDVCRRVEPNGRAILCTLSTAALDDPERAALRARVLEQALDVEVVFVDDAGNVTGLPPPPQTGSAGRS